MAQLESLLTNQIRRAIKDQFPETWTMKVAGGGYQSAGIPDLLAVVKGVFFAFEVKSPHSAETDEHARSRVTMRQQVEIDKINAAGGVSAVVISVDEVMTLIWNSVT